MVNFNSPQIVNDGMHQAVCLVLRCLLICLLLACSAGPQGLKPASAEDQEEGTIAGIVFFSGVPCPPDRLKIPPCDGPYPDYEVIVYQRDGKTVAARTLTDKEGSYRVAVPSGTYIIYSRGLDLPAKTVDIPNAVTVETGKTALFNIMIDTGIR